MRHLALTMLVLTVVITAPAPDDFVWDEEKGEWVDAPPAPAPDGWGSSS